MTCDVSVIIPTHNRLWSLPQCIESCRSLACKSEIIVVDDGSTDGTWEWLQKQTGVIAFRQQNLGKDWAVNRGFADASGDFIRFLDSDDWLLPGTTDVQLSIRGDTGADVIVGGYVLCGERGAFLREQEWVLCDDFIAQQLDECDSSHYSAYLFRRSLIEDIPHRPEAGIRDDRLFVLEVALKKPRVAAYQKPVFAHRQHDNERLQFPKGMRAAVTNFQHEKIYRRILNELDQRGELTDRRKQAAANILWALAHRIAYSHLDEARDLADFVFNLNPTFRIPERGLLGSLYRNLGFGTTEVMLRFRRLMLHLAPRRFT